MQSHMGIPLQYSVGQSLELLPRSTTQNYSELPKTIIQPSLYRQFSTAWEGSRIRPTKLRIILFYILLHHSRLKINFEENYFPPIQVAQLPKTISHHQLTRSAIITPFQKSHEVLYRLDPRKRP